MYKVSILIPLYNCEDLIDKSIESIPVRDDIEIIVLDDCSSDNSFNIVKKYKNIRLYQNKTNLGIGLTRQKLLDLATGEYIFWLDSDDYLYTENFIKVLDKLSDYDIVENIHESNSGHKWYCHVYRGTFIKSDLAKQIKFKNMKCHEDTEWKRDFLKKYKNPRILKSEKLIYHYNYPRVGSLTDINKNSKKNIKISQWLDYMEV